jgi:hypothetical protein
MDILQKPPDWLVKAVPEGGARDFIENGGWYVILGVVALIIVRILYVMLRLLFRRDKGEAPKTTKLEEDLGTYPPLKPSTGDRQLRVEGVPVRMRLIIVAPAGKVGEVDGDGVEDLLERVVPGLGEIYRSDKPRVKIWPRQLSYEGFTKHFQRNMITPEGPGELSRWVLLGGRAKLGSEQIMLGLGLETVKPSSLGRRSVEAHEWASVLRVRVRD